MNIFIRPRSRPGRHWDSRGAKKSDRKANTYEREILILPDGTVWINALNQDLVPMAAALDPTGLFGPYCG